MLKRRGKNEYVVSVGKYRELNTSLADLMTKGASIQRSFGNDRSSSSSSGSSGGRRSESRDDLADTLSGSSGLRESKRASIVIIRAVVGLSAAAALPSQSFSPQRLRS